MSSNRQRVERVPGARRARLTPAPGTEPEPLVPERTDGPDAAEAQAGTNGATSTASGPNDERMRRDVPPHY